MQAEIQRQYDEIIASHYDVDPQSVIGDSLTRAVQQIEQSSKDRDAETALRVLDLGVGTGRFLEKLRDHAGLKIQPYGLDISQKMIDIACRRIPDLTAVVDDAANIGRHFPEQSFDLICTHFITGFVPARVLAPQIEAKLEKGGLWSFVGGSRAGFPALQQAGNSRLVKWLFGIKGLDVGDFVCNPADEAEVVDVLQQHGFRIRASETFRPSLRFKNLSQFLEFGYYGGWLTPFVESLGLHRAKPVLRAILNTCVFPVCDHHSIVITLAQKE